MFEKDQRVRIYLPEIGHLYATVVQDERLTLSSNFVLLHIDGTRDVDHRWINKKHVHAEYFLGQFKKTGE